MRKEIFWVILIIGCTVGCLFTTLFLVSGRAERGENFEKIQSIENSLNKGGDLALAEKDIKEILAVNEKDAWAMRVSAKVHRMQFEKTRGKRYLELAEAEIEKALKRMPQDGQGNAEAAIIYYLQNNKANAVQAINKALKLEPNNTYFKDIKRKIQDMP